MNQVEIIKAILAGEVLDVKHSHGAGWIAFNGEEALIESALDVYIRYYMGRYERAEFRIRPKPKTYQPRAYLVGETNVFHWVSTNKTSQDDALKLYGSGARWIEETQTKEYV